MRPWPEVREADTEYGWTIHCGRLRWMKYPGVYALRARHPDRLHARYAVARYEGRRGARWLCWYFPDGVHQFDLDGYRIAGAPPQGLFSMRITERDAMEDAEHHARTSEIRP